MHSVHPQLLVAVPTNTENFKNFSTLANIESPRKTKMKLKPNNTSSRPSSTNSFYLLSNLSKTGFQQKVQGLYKSVSQVTKTDLQYNLTK